jgi:hypothetical protein
MKYFLLLLGQEGGKGFFPCQISSVSPIPRIHRDTIELSLQNRRKS